METIAAKIARGATNPFTEVMIVTPAIANELLDRNEGNRKPRPAKIRQLVSDIVEGRYAYNGETIIVSDSGELNDGQHRLMAVTQAGASIVTNVTFGVKRDSRMTVDQGVSRNAGGALTVQGRSYGNELAAVARLVLAYEKNGGKSLSQINNVSASATVDRALNDPLVQESVEWAGHVPQPVRPASFAVLAFWRYLAGNNERAREFVEAVAYGDNLARDSVAYLVRTRLGRESRVNRVATEIYLRGLAYYVKGEPFQRVRLMGEFPQIKG